MKAGSMHRMRLPAKAVAPQETDPSAARAAAVVVAAIRADAPAASLAKYAAHSAAPAARPQAAKATHP